MGIIVASSAVGALAGMVTAALIALVFGATRELLNPGIYTFAGSIGAAYGAVLGPTFAFGFMRRVPLGRLFAETGAATVVGGLVGLSLPLGLTGIGSIAAAGAAGFVSAAVRLAWIYRRRGEPAALPPAPNVR